MTVREAGREILTELDRSLAAIEESQADHLVQALMSAERVFVVGVGRVMLSLRAFAKRLNHIGVPAWCVGDTNEPAAQPGDLLVVGSGSGESVIPVAIARVAHEIGVQIVHIGSSPSSSMASYSSAFVRIPVRTRLGLPQEIDSIQPMTSLFEQALYLFCDAVCLTIVKRKGVDVPSLWETHANLE